MRIHFSVDDTIRCFKYLTNKRPAAGSIFESTVFNWARMVHDTYDLDVTFYCMYTDGTFCLDSVPNRWVDEFDDNSEWLKFGFHCYGPDSDYSDSSRSQMLYDYDRVIKEIERITGSHKSITDTIRIHLFSASEAAVHSLSERGVKMLLCADDNRVSYCLKNDEDRRMRHDGFFCLSNNGMGFVPTDIRMEKVDDIEETIRIYKDKDRIVAFTHERCLDDNFIIQRIERLFEGLI